MRYIFILYYLVHLKIKKYNVYFSTRTKSKSNISILFIVFRVMETSSFFVVVPKSKCQPVRDLLRQQRVLDKGRPNWSGIEETVGIPVRWEESQTEMFLELVTEKVGLGLNEVGVVARPNHDKERQSASTRMSKLCQEVTVFCFISGFQLLNDRCNSLE